MDKSKEAAKDAPALAAVKKEANDATQQAKSELAMSPIAAKIAAIKAHTE